MSKTAYYGVLLLLTRLVTTEYYYIELDWLLQSITTVGEAGCYGVLLS